MSVLTVEHEQARPVRPDVLSYPSPTTSRYLVFVTALLAAGLFVGNYVHGLVWGDSWLEVVAACQSSTSAATSDLIVQSRAFAECTAEVERTRTVVMWVGALVVLPAAGALMWLAPPLVVRRRRLRPFPEALDQAGSRFDDLAREAGVEGRVAPLLGATGQRDGFSFGVPGRYRVVLPPAAAVRWRDPSVFDPLVSHELAHVRHRDVALAWLARTVWWVLLPLLAIPVLVGLIERDYSILGGYLWRVALLAGAVTLLSRGLLRSREHGADLRAAQQPAGTGPILALLSRLQTPPSSRTGRLLALHPAPHDRRAVVVRPVLLARTGFVDGLVGGFLSMLAMPLVVSSLIPVLAPVDGSLMAYAVGSAVLGPMLAGSVGLALWRAALMTRVDGPRVPVGRVAAGTGLGLLLGQAVSLDQVGLSTLTGTSRPGWLVVTGVAGAGAVVVSHSLGHLWADRAPRLRHARTAWVVALLVNGLLFGTLLWACTLLQTTVELGGWALARQALLADPLSSWGVVVVWLLLAAFAALTLVGRTGAEAPAWLVGPDAYPWPPARRLLTTSVVLPLGAGVTGAATIAAYRWMAGPGASDGASFQRFQAYQWVAALAGAAVVLVLVAVDRTRGAGAAMAGGPLAVLTVTVGFLVLNTALGGRPDPAFVAGFARPALTLGLYLCLLAAPVSLLLPSRRADAGEGGRPSALRRVTSVALMVALPLAGATTALTARDVLVGPVVDVQPLPDDGASEDLELFGLATELSDYETEVSPTVEQTYTASFERAQQLLDDPSLTPETRQALLEHEVLGPLRVLEADIASTELSDPRMVALHAEAQQGLALAIERYTLLAGAGSALEQPELDALRALEQDESAHWQAWGAQRRAVFEEVRPLLEQFGGQ